MNPAKKMSDLLDKPIEEVNRESAYWLLDSFKEIFVRPEPTTPKRYADYLAMPEFEQRETPKAFWLIPEVKTFLAICTTIKNERESHLKTLKEFKEYLPEEDLLNRSKYEQKIQEIEYLR